MSSNRIRWIAGIAAAAVGSLGAVWACGHDTSLREYLHASFWLPLAHRAGDYERKNVKRVSTPFAGMKKDESATALARLRKLYQDAFSGGGIRREIVEDWEAMLQAIRSDKSLSPRDREEAELIAIKIEMRNGTSESPEPWRTAKQRLQAFLQTTRDPELASEARGWLARMHYKLGEQSAAGKIYLDELNRSGSNLSPETMVNSLRLTYGYDGGPKLIEQLDDYFDTPEHAAFAIQLATNPKWNGLGTWVHGYELEHGEPAAPIPYERINGLLQKHGKLFETEAGARILAMLGMRTALRSADPAAALRIAARIPANSAIRNEPDFLWMSASARFLTRDFAGAEGPLTKLFASPRASRPQKAAAAYGLCGVYRKLGNPVQRIRHALWLKSNVTYEDGEFSAGAKIDDLSVYWAMSGWDLGLILDVEAPIHALQTFIREYPNAGQIRLVKYALAVRLCREGRYGESAGWYQQVSAPHRAARMRKMEGLARDVEQAAEGEARWRAKFAFAEYLAANQERLLFNDTLWYGFQRGALHSEKEGRFTAQERAIAIQQERELKDAQEEYWQAYRTLHEIVRQAGRSPLRRKAAAKALSCLMQINTERFGRAADIAARQRELAKIAAM